MDPALRRGGISERDCASKEECHADRSYWTGFSEVRLRGSRSGCARQNRRARKTLRRSAVSTFFANLPPCLIGMEASNGAHYWARVLSELGHEVRLISPQFVTPYVKSNKNDRNDAEAICEAVGRPTMRFVPSEVRRSVGGAGDSPHSQPSGRQPDQARQSDSRCSQ